jgi:hypothetical protein
MKLNLKARSWHTWVSVILSLPIVVVALTAVFIAHKKALGTEEIRVAAGWLPGYRVEEKKAPGIEARAALLTAGGRSFVGTQGGLFELSDGRLTQVEALGTTQVRALVEAPWGLVAATKSGIWVERDGAWMRTHQADAWSAVAQPDGRVIVGVKDKGLLASADGRRWQPDDRWMDALASLPQETAREPMTLGKLIMDLHTGKAFFGKDGEWIWIDLVGLAMSLLGLTGLWMWWRTQRRKAGMGAFPG